MSVNIQKILLVDDDPVLLKIGSISLKQMDNCQIFLADSGAEAIKLAQADKPDIILMDIMMPEMDGLATYEKMRSSNIEAPVIFMTATDDEDEIKRYKEVGAIGVIKKPINPRSLPTEIKQILSDSRTRA